MPHSEIMRKVGLSDPMVRPFGGIFWSFWAPRNITTSLRTRNISFSTLPVVLTRVPSVEYKIVNILNLMHYAGFMGATQC